MNHPLPFLYLVFLFLNINLSAQIKDNHLAIVVAPFSKKKFVEGNKDIGKKEFETKLATNPTAFAQYQSGKNLNLTSSIIGVTSGLIFGFYLGRWAGGGEEPDGALFAVSGIAWGGALAMGIIGNGKIKRALARYNGDDGIGVKVELGGSGVGLVVEF